MLWKHAHRNPCFIFYDVKIKLSSWYTSWRGECNWPTPKTPRPPILPRLSSATTTGLHWSEALYPLSILLLSGPQYQTDCIAVPWCECGSMYSEGGGCRSLQKKSNIIHTWCQNTPWVNNIYNINILRRNHALPLRLEKDDTKKRTVK